VKIREFFPNDDITNCFEDVKIYDSRKEKGVQINYIDDETFSIYKTHVSTTLSAYQDPVTSKLYLRVEHEGTTKYHCQIDFDKKLHLPHNVYCSRFLTSASGGLITLIIIFNDF
jgi:hypothetical protein